MKKVLTLLLVRQDDRILLGLKKRGFGSGRWNGFGGKVNPSEAIEDAARREALEEAGIQVETIDKVGVIDFEFQGNPELLEVHVFKTNMFSGEPTESDEMKPQWFSIQDIPYSEMWADDTHWLPLVLSGKKLNAYFLFNDKDEVLEHRVEVVDQL